MAKWTNSFIGLMISIFVFSLAVSPQKRKPVEILSNFHKINESFYRGAQPREGGFEKLAEMGIKTVVNLRGADRRARADDAAALAAGLRYFNVPMPSHARPTDEQVEKVLSLIGDTENQPVFIYCRRGADRTGTIAAVYRIRHDRWTSKIATDEARRFGMSFTQFEMRDYIKDTYCSFERKGENCVETSLVERVGKPAATVGRQIYKALNRHSWATQSLREFRSLAH